MRTLLAVCCAALCLCLLAAPAGAGPVLDRILNQMVLDVHNGGINRDVYKTVSPDSPIGQTFTTGPETVEVSRIAIADAYWNDSWSQEKSLVLTLWDSPERRQRIASVEMPYKWKDWEGQVIMYTLNVQVKPNTQYYFELTAKGGDGTIVGIFTGGDYEGGQAYEAGKPADRNIWFEVHSRPALDRDKVYGERFAMWNLDFPGLEKVKAAVQKKDWDIAVDELIRFYESNPEIVDPAMRPKPNPKYDTSYDQLVMDMKIKDENGEIVDLGPNWNHYRTWPTRGGVGLTRSGIMRNPAGAYRNTGDDKWAKCFNDMLNNMLNDMPSPLRAGSIQPGARDINPSRPCGIGGGSMWSGLSIGARMNQMWYYYSEVAASPAFTRDVRAGMIFNMVDMAEMLSIEKGGGNWESQMSTALYELADRHPELARAKEWFNKGLETMVKNLWETSRFDGTVQEPTYNYTTLIINRYRRLLDTCKKLNVPLEKKYIDRVEKTIEYLMFTTEPDGDLPSRGDSFNFVSSKEQLKWGADYYGRDDFRYVATGGREGKAPLATSAYFPIGGWCDMRSGWDRDARYLHLHNGKDLGHGHADELSISVDAYGSKLIADPGCYVYGTPYQGELFKSRKHATVTVDDKDTHTERGTDTWASLQTIDYYNGTNAGYSGLDGVNHTRKIMFLKPGYWFIADSVSGSGEHEVVSRFPFFPGKIQLDAKTGICRTLNAGGNLEIVPCPGSGFAAETYSYDFPRDGLKPAPAVKYSRKTSLPTGLAYALMPFKGKTAPRVSVTRIGENGYEVSGDGWTDYIAFGDVDSGEVSFRGEALALRLDAVGDVRSIALVNGTSVSLGSRQLILSGKPIRNLEITRSGDMLVIDSSARDPLLKVDSLGASSFRAGCGPSRPVTEQVIAPFVK